MVAAAQVKGLAVRVEHLPLPLVLFDAEEAGRISGVQGRDEETVREGDNQTMRQGDKETGGKEASPAGLPL
jgi:hypothetical protein